jgi:hypothetical protein
VPTRKQRRRRQKERRHEWEEVYVDESGREIDPDEVEQITPQTRTRENGRRPAQARTRGARTVEPPSWRRVAKRGLIFAPFMFIVISVLDPSTGIPARVLYTLQLILLFVPFSYLVDTVSYRVYQKRAQQPERRPSRS